MVALIIIAVLVVLILLIFFVPYGVDVGYLDEVFRLNIKAGPLRIRILPKKPKTARQLARAAKKKAKKEAKKQAQKAKKAAKAAAAPKEPKDESQKVKPKKKIEFSFVIALLKMAAHAIQRFFRSFRIDDFELHYVAASDDPYNTAIQYAYACAAVEALPDLTGKVIHVKHKNIEIGSDFTQSKPVIEGRITLTLQLFRLVHLVFALAAEFIGYKMKHRDESDADAVDERMDNNGRQPDERTHGIDDKQDSAAC